MIMTAAERSLAISWINKFMSLGFEETYREKSLGCGGMYNWLRQSGLPIEYADGATKCVFIIDELDWVIMCSYPNEIDNYCAREADNYAAAVECGLEYYFAATFFLATIGGIEFYAQKKVCCDESIEDIVYEKVRESGDAEDYDGMEAYSASRCTDLIYGNCCLNRFIEDRRINDLHCGNFGYDNDHYVMVDYSGFGLQVFAKEEE